MMHVKNILVLIDDFNKSKFAIKKALHFASMQKRVHLHFVKIVDSFCEINKVFNTPHIEKLLLREMTEQISHLLDPKHKNVTTSFDIKEGISFIEVTHEVVRYRPDILIIPEPSAKESGFSSNIFHIIRKCPCPIWVLRTSKAKEIFRILVAVDIDMNEKVRRNVNNQCMAFANLIASSEKAKIDVAHAWHLRNEYLLRSDTHYLRIAHHQIDIMSEREKKYHKEWFTAWLKKQKKVPINRMHFIHGDATEVIPQIVKKEKINLLIMGSVGSIKTPGLLISNRAETILQNVDCSVITIKPEGFITPIQ